MPSPAQIRSLLLYKLGGFKVFFARVHCLKKHIFFTTYFCDLSKIFASKLVSFNVAFYWLKSARDSRQFGIFKTPNTASKRGVNCPSIAIWNQFPLAQTFYFRFFLHAVLFCCISAADGLAIFPCGSVFSAISVQKSIR
jgi:hypothetical protein